MLTQISENRELAEVFDELFAAEGSEIYLRPAERLRPAGRADHLRDVVEAARRRGECAIGYRHEAGPTTRTATSACGSTRPKSEPSRSTAGDRVVVLAEE